MNVDTMRKVDYYAGVPLTFILSSILKLFALIKKPRAIKAKNILLIELSEMGSTILADPMMKLAQQKLNANLFFVIFAKNKPSLKILNTIDEQNIFTIKEDNMQSLIVDTLKFLWWCRKNHIDTVIDLELFSRFSALLSGASGAKNRVGFYSFFNEGLYRGDMLTHKVAYNPHIHISKNFIALLHPLLSNKEEIPYSKIAIKDVKLDKVHSTNAQKEIIYQKILKRCKIFKKDRYKIVLINPNASELLPQRRWPLGYYKELIKLLLREFDDIIVLITGAPSESKEADFISKNVADERCVNFTGGVAFEELVHLYNVSTLMVTNDSGPGHFSSVTDLKVFIFFGPETPLLYGSLGNSEPIYANLACSPCVSAANHRKTACMDNVCLKVIEPLEVFKKVSSYLKLC